MALTAAAVQQVLEQLAPPALAESWDNVGLLLGDPAQMVTTVIVALDASASVLDQAAAVGAELVVTHHPLIFSGVKRVVEDGGILSLVRRLIRDNCALLALHTNLDSAPNGLNQYVAELLGLEETRPLVPTPHHPLLKLVVYVPETHVEAVREAICQAGAGAIGRYRECTFGAPGIGTFRPEEGARPFIGRAGVLERVPEIRLETVVPRAALSCVLAAMLAAHPYEEVAYDLFSLENRWPAAGLGRVGLLPHPMSAEAFLHRVRTLLDAPATSFIGDPARMVHTVALCTGAGGDFLDDALHAGADLYLTGEVKHHQALQARQQGIALIAAGHFATERPVVHLLADYLQQHCATLAVHRAMETDPFVEI